ncbi:MAG: TerB family tellurite resistance protein [Limnothrix sp. RL_2_0]|nr:TerB family tellurite resistance protein [Limnothrix sp. RL_2_0]
MNELPSFLDGFSPDLYLATLSQLAHSDGLHPDERVLLEQQAITFGLDLNDLSEVPHDLSDLPWSTKVFVYRDSIILAYVDGSVSEEEEKYLIKLSERLDICSETAQKIRDWVNDYSDVLNRLENILKQQA